MDGKYTRTFFSNEIARVSFNKSQQTNITREGCENLSSPKATITWCQVPQTLKNASKIKGDIFLSPLILHPLKLTYLSKFCPRKQHPEQQQHSISLSPAP